MIEIPHAHNFCGGNYQDWLEVNLLPECNGKCKWCVEKLGWHPKTKADWFVIADKAINTGKKNIILLGGEPTLYKDLCKVILRLRLNDKNVYMTTNGSKLNREFVMKNLAWLTGINISVHDYRLQGNHTITGINLSRIVLFDAIKPLKEQGCKVRFNCNLIDGYIDSIEKVENYINWAKKMGAESVRFSELKHDEENFVDLYKLFGDQYGLNDDPYLKGCNNNVEINGMHVNFRQMCGLQTKLRPPHQDYKKYPKQVLYYDGNIYDGWQVLEDQKESEMDRSKIKKILEKYKNDKIDEETVMDLIEAYIEASAAPTTSNKCGGGGCVY